MGAQGQQGLVSTHSMVWGLMEFLQLLWRLLAEYRRGTQINALSKRKVGSTWPLAGEFGSSWSPASKVVVSSSSGGHGEELRLLWDAYLRD